MASSTLIETININADDFTDNFLTCPTCMSAYDEADHTPKLLPCSHTLCRSCLERIAASATAVTSPGGVSDAVMASSSIATNSIARTIAAADAAVAAMNAMSSTAAALSPSSSSSNSQLNESSRQNGHGQGSVASSRLSSSSLASSSNRNSSGGSGLLHSNLSSQSGAQQSLIVDMCIRCPICRESIILPRNGGVLSLPPSFIINQLLDLVKSKKSRDIIPRCTNHTNEELLFCETCDKSFCSICESHFKSTPANADHIIVPFSIAIKRMAEIYLFKSNQCISSFNLALSNVQNEIINLNSTVENVVQLVDESFNELKRVLDKRRHELFKQLTKIKENKTTLLNEQIKLIVNERQKVEIECKRYQQQEASNLVESKLLCAQIQNINEKLDCLRTLCEPRENSFIDYEYKFNDCMDDIDGVMRRFGRFKISNTYPPLCTARILDDTVFNALANTSQSNSKESVYSTSRHLSVTIQIDTVDYYGKKRTEGGDPISIIITDPSMSRLQYTTQKPHQKPPEKLDQEPAIVDQNNGSYRFTFTPNLIGRYRLDISIFSRSIYQMPIFVVVNEFADPLWTFGGVSSNASSNSMASSTPTTSSSTLLRNFSFHNKGTGDRDFNMPICVRCVDKLIYILDSGNDRIKILNKNGQFVGNIKYEWLNGSSSTALALHVKNNTVSLITLNWRLKSMSKYNLETKTAESFTLAELDEPIAISETFHPDLFIVQDNKRKLYLCTSFGSVLYDSLEARLKTACNIKSVVCLCGDPFERRIFLAGITANNSPSPIYEISLDWLCDFRLDEVLKTLDPVHMPKPNLTSNVVSNSTFQAFTYPDSQDQQKSLSSSLTSLTSTVSVTSTTTTLTSNSTGCGGVGHSKTGQHSTTSSYTALWYDTSTQKLLAAKSDKQKTVIEIFNSCTRSYEYSISESSAKKSSSEKQLKKVTSICSTDDGRFLCVDLVQNLVKFFRFT